MQNLEQEKKNKAKLLADQAETKNKVARQEVELGSIKNQIEILTIENNRLKSDFETQSLEKVNTLKEKQSSSNSIKVL